MPYCSCINCFAVNCFAVNDNDDDDAIDEVFNEWPQNGRLWQAYRIRDRPTNRQTDGRTASKRGRI